jgi:hypothetical protein
LGLSIETREVIQKEISENAFHFLFYLSSSDPKHFKILGSKS